MQKSESSSPSDISSDEFERGCKAIDPLLATEEASFKRWSVDYLAVQHANARNYLWVSFVIMSACAAFYDRSSVFESGLNGGAWGYTIAACLCFCFTLAGFVFFGGLVVLSGSTVFDPIPDDYDPLACAQAGEFSPVAVFTLKHALHDAYLSSIAQAREEVVRRSAILKRVGLATQLSLCFGLGAMFIYLAKFCL